MVRPPRTRARHDARLAMDVETFERLQDAMLELLDVPQGDSTRLEHMRHNYAAGNFPGSEKTKSKNVRFWFDCFYFCLQNNRANMPDLFRQPHITNAAIGSAVRRIVGDCVISKTAPTTQG